MQDFLNTNPGFASRFTKHIFFEDYKPEELTAIFVNMVKKKSMVLGKGVEDQVRKLMELVYAKRNRNFANGRTVRNIFEDVLQQQASRIAKLAVEGSISPEDVYTITIDDIKEVFKKYE
jgi:hypothetical protein